MTGGGAERGRDCQGAVLTGGGTVGGGRGLTGQGQMGGSAGAGTHRGGADGAGLAGAGADGGGPLEGSWKGSGSVGRCGPGQGLEWGWGGGARRKRVFAVEFPQHRLCGGVLLGSGGRYW